MQQTFEQLSLEKYPTSTVSVPDFLAKITASLHQCDSALKAIEVASFMKSAESPELKNLNIFSLKTSRDYFQSVEQCISQTSLLPWRNWGISLNGRCVTADVYCPITDPGCSLSDIVEMPLKGQSFLSMKSLTLLLNKKNRGQKHMSLVCLQERAAPRLMKLTSVSLGQGQDDLHQGNCLSCKVSCQNTQTKHSRLAYPRVG